MEKVSYRPLLWRLSLTFAAGILFLSCGFEPAWKSQDTTVSFRLGPAARAVALGGGYLYIRPLGGPLGIGPKPYLGPIELSAGDTFTTTEIAPGSYEGFVVFYSPRKVGDMYVGGMLDAPIGEVLRSSDDDVMYLFGEMIDTVRTASDNAGSLATTEPVTVVEGEVNELYVVLEPVTSYEFDALSSYQITETNTGYHRKYIRMYNANYNFIPGSHRRCTVNAESDTISIHKLAFFREDGSSWPAIFVPQSNEGVLTDYGNTPENLYIYAEYTTSVASDIVYFTAGELIY